MEYDLRRLDLEVRIREQCVSCATSGSAGLCGGVGYMGSILCTDIFAYDDSQLNNKTSTVTLSFDLSLSHGTYATVNTPAGSLQ